MTVQTVSIAAGTALTGWLLTAPDAVSQVWNTLPPELIALIPAEYTPVITGTITLLVAISKLIKMRKAKTQ